LNGQRYALPIERVQEIQQIVAFSEVPGGSSGVVGMINLRGHVIPAVDMRRLLGIAPQEYTLDTPMIICRVDGQLVALVADEVQDVVELPEGSIQDAPAMHALSSKMLGVARMDDGLI
jgi:purine-binding chemotaxis protein CheW